MNVSEFDQLLPDLEGTGDEELHKLVERAHQIELMTQHPGWPYFRDYLSSLTMSAQSYVLSGRCKNVDEYRDKTGYLKGISAAMNAPAVLLDRISRLQAYADESNV